MEKVDTIDRGVCNKQHASCAKLEVYDWMQDISCIGSSNNVIEVRFKNTRKDYYRNVNNLKLNPGDLVAVEANPGHDIGIVSLMGELVAEQMKKHKVTQVNGELRKVYRKAKQVDIDKWRDAISMEHRTMIRSRQITADLKLDMKIGDVEYQGDGTKAIFYYIADGRVDFRQLIKVLAENFRIRVEMKQIGARQEAGRIGGIGPCGRELCCASWMSNFVSVTTNAARQQEISLNPQKLAGQCGKLKCCLNYELSTYIDAQKDFPPNQIPLHTQFATFEFMKADVFKGIYWYYSKGDKQPPSMVAIPVKKVKQIQRMNKQGNKPEKLVSEGLPDLKKEEESFTNMVGQEDLDRFDRPKKKIRKKKRKSNRRHQIKPKKRNERS